MASSASDIYVKLQKLSNEATKTTLKFNKEEANSARTFNAAEAQKARDWQQMMSEQSHQMEVKDLKKAGLNPVLSANNGGATSYTTSSASGPAASGQAENAAGAVASAWSADQSAKATRYAANQSAAATKAAANAGIRQAQIAAAAQMYAADKNQENVNKRIEADKWIATNKQASNIAGLADKYIGQYASKAQLKDTVKIGKTFNEKDFSNKKGSITKDNFVLSRTGEKKANQALHTLGLTQNRNNRILYVQAYVYGSKNAALKLAKLVANNKKAAKNASSRNYLYV